ncbi:di-heme-cytochrome C peroxidase [Methyloglobulus sp.]|uniref:di-heme-cytochrome C peroxidase n=1 Tax=Methyloglobulus sp. TaxID=2518622 RepID=UPI0032B7646F
MKIKELALCMMAVLATGTVYGSQPNAKNIEPKTPIYLDQQWTNAERQKFYFTPQGSYLIPYAWYLALESANKRNPFNDPKNIRRYGYLVDEHYSSDNPDKLPVGFAKEPVVQGEAWLGYTCAACHTNDIRYKGQTVRVDGAPALADFTAFLDGLNAALDSTLNNEKRFNRFANAVLGVNSDPAARLNLKNQVAEHTDWLKGFANRSKPTHAYGAGRVDAFGVIMNEVFGRDLDVAENVKVPDAPVSYPFLWGTPQHDFVQWNGSAFNPFGRNVGEVLGTFGRVNLDITSPEFGKTTARARELFELERLVAKLDKPSWPEALLGQIDQASAFRGQVLYTQSHNGEESCADCHSLPDSTGHYPSTPPEENLFGVTFIKTHMIPLTDIGTDPLMATNFALRSVKTGNVALILPAPYTNASDLPAPLLLSILVGTAAQNGILDAQPPFSPLESAELIGYRQKAAGLPPYLPPNLLAYRARPLDGIWATAPYLHNGSVASLYELLLPPAERSQVFYVGNREFDPEAVGFKSGRSKNGFRFDAQFPGNRNSGHVYGTDLNQDQRRDLLEFLKTL